MEEKTLTVDKYAHIKAHSIKVAQYYQDKLNEIVEKYKTSKDSTLLDEMYKTLIKLNEIVFSYYSVYTPESRSWICDRLASEIVIKHRDKGFNVDYWFKYLRLAILHVRDDYIQMEKSQNSDIETSGYEEMNCNTLYQDQMDLFYSMDELFKISYRKALSRMSEFLDMSIDDPKFYLRLLDIRLNKEVHLYRLFDRFILEELQEEVKLSLGRGGLN